MLERGLISWLVTSYLSALDTVRLYGLEYRWSTPPSPPPLLPLPTSTALLMNLCLHRAGKEQCVPLASTVLDLLLQLLVKDLKPVKTTKISAKKQSAPRSTPT